VLEAITPRTKAILVVHLYGHPVDMDPLKEIADDHKLLLLEDSAQAHGALYKGKKAGSLGDGGIFSFYATKNMTTGEGGIIVTNDDDMARKAGLLRNHGQESKYVHVVLGYNYRMTDLMAAIGIVQLKKIDFLNAKRRENAYRLTKGLSSINGVVTPVEREYAVHVYHQYVIRILRDSGITRDLVADKLREKNIETAVHYPITIPEQPLYKKLGIKCRDGCPNAKKISREVLSIPVHPGLTQRDIDYIIQSIHDVIG